jgi:hypothetical protein
MWGGSDVWHLLAAAALLAISCSEVTAHGVADDDKAFIEKTAGAQLVPFVYLGAKHMVTGYDHLLFLVGVIFFLYRTREVAAYVTLFAIGHSVTLLYGVLGGTHVNPYLVDAVIGLSVVYKALDNLGAYRRWLGVHSRCRRRAWSPTSWPSTLVSKPDNCWPWAPSSLR